MVTKDGKIVDEINGIISSRDSIRTTMVGAGVYGVTNSSKLADLAVKLADAKLPGDTYTIAASDSVTIPAGKLTTGDQKITAKSLASQTPGDAAAGDILSGKIAWVDGAKVTGNIPTVTPSTTGPLICGASASISKGYLASDVTITAKDLASQTPGTADAADIRLNKTAWVGGTKVNGTMPDGTYSASVSATNGSASMTATGVSTTTSSNCYVTLSTTPGSAKGTATVGTGGYITAGSKESSTSVSVNGNGTKLYLATYTPSTITVTNSSQTLSTSGKVCTGNITIPAVNYYYTSTAAPSSTSGYNDGDVWLVTA